jgi:ADP-dependent NAD(P)H-hydrate dehydratase / NAD(P)H-hydrate epimerase
MPVPVLSTEQMREWEAASWRAGRDEKSVIQRAGFEVARAALRETASGDRVLVLAGRGNNGADARAAAQALPQRGVELLPVADPGAALDDLRAALARKPALVLDGLFGIGLNRPLDAAWIAFIRELNDAALPVLAVDVPSGLDAGSGRPLGAAVRADWTVTLGAPKHGLVQPHAWPHTGRLLVAPDIGLVPCPFHGPLQWTLESDLEGWPPRRAVNSHKGALGHLHIVAGSYGFHGAAALATRAAQRARPGLVTLHTMESVHPFLAPAIGSAMSRAWSDTTRIPDDADALLFGPGLAGGEITAALRNHLKRLWEVAAFPVVADASALDWLHQEVRRTESIRVMTPHPGEAARLLGTTAEQIQRDRPGALHELSRRYNDCWVVLKGHQTLVGRAGETVFINDTGNPGLAQGGSGDALAGFISGLLAQPRLNAEPLRTLRHAVREHGAAADRLERRCRNWLVEDLIDELGR